MILPSPYPTPKMSAAHRRGNRGVQGRKFPLSRRRKGRIRAYILRAEKGQTVAFIGSTGSGKSTLINLVPRFYDATEGEVLVDGVNVKNIKQSTLRSKIGYVPQKGVLFSGTVAENIGFGGNTGRADIEEAAKVAEADGFITEMGGYDSPISPGRQKRFWRTETANIHSPRGGAETRDYDIRRLVLRTRLQDRQAGARKP